MFAVKKAPQLDSECDDAADRLAVGAGKIYWLTMVLLDNAEDAAVVTRQSIELLTTGNRIFDVWLSRWACKTALKICIATKHSELAADQRNPRVWNQAVDRRLLPRWPPQTRVVHADPCCRRRA